MYFTGAAYDASPKVPAQRAVTVPSGQEWRYYYYAGGVRVAERVMTTANPTGTLSYLLTDHLGSTTITATTAGEKSAEIE